MAKKRKKAEVIMTEEYIGDLEFIGSALRYARKASGMSMRSLTTMSGVQAYQISNIENGKSGTKTHTLHRLFNALGVSLEEGFKNYELFKNG